MKEPSIEEKSYEVYTELINRLEDVKNAIKKQNYGIAMDILDKPYPEFQITTSTELKEREDRKIKSDIQYAVRCAYGDNSSKTESILAWIDEQKPAYKVKPKFHKGDWIITNKNHIWYVDETPETTSYLYRLINQNGKVEVAEFEVVDKKARLWTIKDAKDGDVLFYDSTCGFTFIYNGINPQGALLYSYLESNDGSPLLKYNIGKPNVGVGYATDKNIYPATKEQRDLLFKKMYEAGYEWDAEKKEH